MLTCVVASKKFSTTPCAMIKLNQLIQIVAGKIYLCLYVFISSCAKLTVSNPRNVIGPTKAVEIDTYTDTKINNKRVKVLYDIPKLIAWSRPNNSTSKYGIA